MENVIVVRMFGSSMDFTSGWSPSYFPTGCGSKSDPYEELSYKLDGLLTAEYGSERIDFKYIDVASPEILEYINDIETIVDGRLPLPYVSMNKKPLCWGLSDAGDILTRVRLKMEE